MTKNVLFLCTGNAARSIMAESLLNHWGKGQLIGFSAGQFPNNAVHPLVLEVLNQHLLPTENLRSKSWDEFAAPGAPVMDSIITLCDTAAGEVPPAWPDHPATAQWAITDPAAAVGTRNGRLMAFRTACRGIEAKIRLMLTAEPART